MQPFPSRRTGFFLALSISLHLALFVLGPFRKPPEVIHANAAPLSVRLNPGPPGVEVVEPEPTPARPQRPVPPQPTPPRPPQVARAAPQAAPTVPKSPLALPPPDAQRAPAPPLPVPPTAPPVDMLAMIESRREARKRAAQAAGGTEPTDTAPKGDVALANIQRNLRSLREGEGTGGVFQVLEKTAYHASFAFNGWQPERNKKWREVIEVEVKPGDDIERAIIVRMITLIRTHYTGDFQWESHRLDRVVVLSARPQDQPGLEEFLMREFFGTPVRAMR